MLEKLYPILTFAYEAKFEFNMLKNEKIINKNISKSSRLTLFLQCFCISCYPSRSIQTAIKNFQFSE